MIANKSKYEIIDRMSINVGDTIYTLNYPSYGWNSCFRYPIIRKHTVTKITPKRTKIETDNGELDKNVTVYKLNDQLIADAKLASLYRSSRDSISHITAETLAKLNDDDLRIVAENIKNITEILSKEEYQTDKNRRRTYE